MAKPRFFGGDKSCHGKSKVVKVCGYESARGRKDLEV